MLEQGYWLMPNEVLFSKDLSDKQKLLFCLISSLCAEKWYCRASNEYLWERLSADKRTIARNISTLWEKWFITIEIENNCQRKITLDKNVMGVWQKCHGGYDKNVIQILQENNTSEKKENKKEKYLEFVYLTNEEYNKLIDTYWERATKEQIRNLNNYIWQKGKDKYKSHYYTILTWNRKAWIKELPKKQENESWIYDLPF